MLENYGKYISIYLLHDLYRKGDVLLVYVICEKIIQYPYIRWITVKSFLKQDLSTFIFIILYVFPYKVFFFCCNYRDLFHVCI